MTTYDCADCEAEIESEPYLIAQFEDRYEVYHMDCGPGNRSTTLVTTVERLADDRFPDGEYRTEVSKFNDGEIRVCAFHNTDTGRECIYHGTDYDAPEYRAESPPDYPARMWDRHPLGAGVDWSIDERRRL